MSGTSAGPSPFSVRRAREDDAGAIVSLLNPIIEARIWTIMTEPVSIAGQVAFIRGLPERAVCHVAQCDESGDILGLQDVLPVSAEPALAHVGAVSTFVALRSHGHGIGRSLCRATFDTARGRGFRKVMATIRADNPRAIGFYRRQGFEVIGTARRQALVDGRYVDEIITEHWIDDAGDGP